MPTTFPNSQVRALPDMPADGLNVPARTLIDHMAQGVMLTDADGTIRAVNPAFCRITGYALEEVKGQNSRLLKSGRHSAAFYRSLWSALRTEGTWTGEIENRRKNGEVYTEALTVTAIPNERDETLQYMAVFTDISKQKEAEEKLIRSNRELENFCRFVAHDLQAPLRRIICFADLLKSESSGLSGKGRRSGQAIQRSADQMAQMVKTLLDYSRLNGRRPERSGVNMEELVAEVLKSFEIAIEESGAAIIIDPLPLILGDRLQIARLMANLIENAIKYRGTQRPRILISSQRKNDDTVFLVRDNGIGIDPAHVERIFDLFYRAPEGPANGTGIGLAIAKKMVEEHGGRIWVESNFGEGSTFYFTLPAADLRD